MTCPKCGATMFRESALRFLASADYTVDLNDARSAYDSYHCLSCGTYADRVILANRARQADERRLVARAETLVVWACLQASASHDALTGGK